MNYDIKDLSLADRGKQRIAWAARHMPVLQHIRQAFAADQPFQAMRIAASLHITTETAVLLQALHAGGAEIALCASNPLSTFDDVCAALVTEGISVYASYGEDLATYQHHIEETLACDPHLVMDDGADLIVALHRHAAATSVLAGIEETTTGVLRARALASEGLLRFPVIAVNDTPTKRFFDNRYGTGQNTIDGILRATNTLLAGSTFVVAGYGWCGRGIALRARGMGARVMVCEVSAIKALEAVMDGFQVLPMADAAPLGDIFVTATGISGVIRSEHFLAMKNGAILANSGHFDVEVDVAALRDLASREQEIREHLTEFVLPNGRALYLLAQGRLVGQVAAEASPAAVMDLSFADQALCTRYLLDGGCLLPPGVHDVPPEIDERVASLKLQALGIHLDTLDEAQRTYQQSWQPGTAEPTREARFSQDNPLVHVGEKPPVVYSTLGNVFCRDQMPDKTLKTGRKSGYSEEPSILLFRGKTMYIPEIQLLFDYYYWATAHILSATEKVSHEQFTQVRVSDQRSLRATLVHALSSERNWRVRWQGNEPLADLDEQPFPTLASLRTYWKQQEQEMRTFLASIREEDLARLIEGVTDEGTAYADPIWHSMMHVLFHGAQHRSEAAEIVTEYGFSPGELDFFVFLRQKSRDQGK